MDKVTLKPCPWCNHRPVLDEELNRTTNIGCFRDECPAGHRGVYVEAETSSEAIALWNSHQTFLEGVKAGLKAGAEVAAGWWHPEYDSENDAASLIRRDILSINPESIRGAG